MRSIVVPIGTQAEIIKVVPVLRFIDEVPGIPIQVVTTGQHPAHIIARAWDELSPGISLGLPTKHAPDWELKAKFSLLNIVDETTAVLAIGDTNSARIAIEAASVRGAPGIHLEAGLRLPTIDEPEEYNRRLMARLATWHLAPFEEQKRNLIGDRVDPRHIRVVGDLTEISLAYRLDLGRPVHTNRIIDSHYILFTLHRWSNLLRLNEIESFLEHQMSRLPSGWRFIVVMRSDSRLQPLYEKLGSIGCVLLESQSPRQFLDLLSGCDVVLTDSAGVQQEAVLLGKPCGVLRHGVELYRNASEVTLDVDHTLDIEQLITWSEAHAEVIRELDDWQELASRAIESIVEIVNS
jgi:UDP-N-acetylglucosamine 2-epimerase (non-hydrolysing)